jgi:SM-20-related protein
MPSSDFFASLGLLVVKNFLSEALCEDLKAQMDAAQQQQAWTYNYASGVATVDEEVRKTREALVSQRTRQMMRDRLMELQPAVEAHFDKSLTSCRLPNFLVYREGDFFRMHRDSAEQPANPSDEEDADWQRNVSIVIFLNKQSEAPQAGTYGGGALSFFGLIDKPGWQNYGFPLVGEPGLLVAFSPDIYHQVSPVLHGERYTIVSWFI